MRSSGRVKPDTALRNSTSQLVPSVSPAETLLPARLLTSTIACGQSSLRGAERVAHVGGATQRVEHEGPDHHVHKRDRIAAEVPLKKSSFTPAAVKRSPAPSESM